MLALGYMAIFAGALLLISGLTGSTVTSVAKGEPDRAKAIGGPAAGLEGGVQAGVPSEAGAPGSTAPVHSQPGGRHTAPPPSSFAHPSSSSAGGGTPVMKAYVRAYAHNLHWNAAHWEDVIEKESSWNPSSTNRSTGAYGLGQFNPEGSIAHPRAGSAAALYAHAGATSPDWRKQVHAMALYIYTRYGNPTNALAHEHSAGWY